MPSSKKVTKRSSDSRSLRHRILVAIYDFTGRMIDQEQLQSTADEIEKALDKNYHTLAISSLFINDIEKILKLKWTRKDTELADLRPMECPPVLGKQAENMIRRMCLANLSQCTRSTRSLAPSVGVIQVKKTAVGSSTLYSSKRTKSPRSSAPTPPSPLTFRQRGVGSMVR
jgi:hypothetical protein